MELKDLIKIITNDTIAKADIIKRVKGKVLSVADNVVSIQINTMQGAIPKHVTIKNNTGMIVDVGDIVWIYYWRNINDGWILPANMKLSDSRGVGEFINGTHTSERFNDYSGNTLSDFKANNYVSLVGSGQKAIGANSTYSTILDVYMNGANNIATLSSPIYAEDSHFDYSNITGTNNSVTSQTITGTFVYGKDNTISLSSTDKCENFYVVGYNNEISGDVRGMTCFGKDNTAAIGSMVSIGNHILFLSNGGVLLPNAAVSKSKTLIGDRPIISYQKQAFPNSVIMAFGGIVDGNDVATNNVMEVDYQGNLSVYGTINSGTGSDFAEYEEWADGNENNADRRGLFVVEQGNYIRLANSDDDVKDILGVVSANPTLAGGANSICWKDTYKRDVFGSIVTEHKTTEDVTTDEMIINQTYNSSLQYVDRTHRQEFSPIAYIGKVVMIDDGTCEIDGYCKSADNGIATRSKQRTRFRVRERIDETHILVRIL